MIILKLKEVFNKLDDLYSDTKLKEVKELYNTLLNGIEKALEARLKGASREEAEQLLIKIIMDVEDKYNRLSMLRDLVKAVNSNPHR